MLSDIGLTPGDSFDYVATYLNSSNAFRSDEFYQGAAFAAGNPGTGSATLTSSNTFVSVVPEPSLPMHWGLACWR